MRFRSKKTNGFQVFAVSGVNTVSFGIHADDDVQDGLLGFGIVREDPTEHEKYPLPGFKVFPSVNPHPDKNTRVSTLDHPIQSFVSDDFTAKPGREYTYSFIPMTGQPKHLVAGKPIPITIRTEPLFSKSESEVFFNRGVASSQAYAREFRNLPPDKLPPAEAARAREWLSRKLDDALLQFINDTPAGDALRCCFYEFHYAPVLDALKQAVVRGVDVKIIIDAKVNESTDKDGTFHESFPREANLRAIEEAKLSKKNIILREARPDAIEHNKFMVRLEKRRSKLTPTQVWTGSTNISDGGIHGQTNVGHWIRNAGVAERFLAYWELLSDDPGGRADDEKSEVLRKNKELRAAVEALNDVPTSLQDIEPGITTVFSPRSKLDILHLYYDLVCSAPHCGCITLAFGVGKDLKQRLLANTSDSAIVFLLLEKRDAAKKNSKTEFIPLTAKNNVYSAWGSFLKDSLYDWVRRETNPGLMKLNSHVSYIHSKFLLYDPLRKDPIVISGSANFSDASTKENDENLVMIRGDQRAADIYFTEFNRLFNHYYYRSVQESTRRQGTSDDGASVFLKEKAADWLCKYKPGLLKRKRLDLYTGMEGFA